MNEITINTASQTPIEIALGIDEEGMTTARKLYAFLVRETLQKMISQPKMRIICDSSLRRRHRQVALFKEKIINSLPALQRNFLCSQRAPKVNKPDNIFSK